MDLLNGLDQPSATDVDSLLDTLSLDLMENNIDMQINYQIPSTTDFLSTVIAKFKYILSMDGIDDTDKSEIKYQMVDFCDGLIKKIADAYNLFINQISEDVESKFELLESLYNFLVIHRVDNTEEFLLTYISKYKEQLVDLLELDDKNRDITSISNKKKNLSRENVCILSSLSEVIDFIRQNNTVDPVEFITLINDGELYTDRLLGYYQDATVSGDFVGPLLDGVLMNDYDEGELARIRNNIRVSLCE